MRRVTAYKDYTDARRATPSTRWRLELYGEEMTGALYRRI